MRLPERLCLRAGAVRNAHLPAWGLPKYFIKRHETALTGPGTKAVIFLKLMREKGSNSFLFEPIEGQERFVK